MGQYLETRIAFVRACNLITLIVFIFGAVHLMSFGWPVLFPMIAASATFLSMLTGTYLVFVARPKFDMQHHEHALDRLRRAGAWPTIDVFLPICGEPAEVLLNTWRHVARLDYPGQLRVYVLDDSKTEAMKAHALRHGFNYLRRPNPGEWKKAGNLKAAFDRTCGEFILVLDADFTPRSDMVRRLLVHMEPTIGIVQSPQFFRSASATNWLMSGAGSVQEYFYRAVQPARDVFDAAICVGSCALYRREALAANGGPTLIEHSEDVHTGFDIAVHGWGLRYVPLNLAVGLCPDRLAGFHKQQYRWCSGSMSLFCSAKFWRARLTVNQRLCFFNGFLYYISTAIRALTAPLLSAILLLALPHAIKAYGFIGLVPLLAIALFVFPAWHSDRYGLETWSVKQIYAWSHLLALLDTSRGTVMPWESTGSKEKTGREFRRFFTSFTWWHLGSYLCVLALMAWRLDDIGVWNMLPLLALTAFTAWLSWRVVLLGLRERRDIRSHDVL